MALNKVKGLLSSAMAVATVLSTIPAVNVTAAEAPAPVIDAVQQYELDLFTYGPELLRENVPGFDNMDPVQFEAVKDLYVDGNYFSYDTLKQITYSADGTETSRREYEYSPASGKEIKETSYYQGQVDDIYEYEYDGNGRQTKYSHYDKNGKLTWYSTYEYNEKGQTTSYKSYNSEGNLTGYSTYERTYWDNGKNKTYSYKSYSLRDGNFVVTYGYDYEYNENGSTIRDINYSYDYSKNELYESSRYEYVYEENEYGWSTQTRMNHYTKGEFDYYETYDGNIYYSTETEHTSTTYRWNPDSSLNSTYKYISKKFGGDSNWIFNTIKRQTLDANGNITSEEIYERDDSGTVISQAYYNNGNLSYKYTYEYDDNGNTKRSNYYGSSGTLSSYTIYEYCKNEFFDNGHYVPDFDAYHCDEGCVFNYRLYNPNSGEHFYTGSREEALMLVEAGWNFEGPGFVNPTIGDPVYRLYNSNLGDHLYTKDVDEINSLIGSGDWTFDGGEWAPAFPTAPDTGKPMYRLYNPNAWDSGKAGAFHFTMSEEERDHLVSLGWKDQGIGWYSV